MHALYKKFGFTYLGGINIASKFKKLPSLMTYLVYLLPNSLSGAMDVCPYSTPDCRSGCLHFSGQSGVQIRSNKTEVHNARLNRTLLLKNDPESFFFILHHEISYHHSMAVISGMDFLVRLNGTSDIYHDSFIRHHPGIQFYDYTKNHNLLLQDLPENYHITFSYSGYNTPQCLLALRKGINVSVLFNRKPSEGLPKAFCFPFDPQKKSFPVIDGDLHDKRTIDQKGAIVGLRFKNITPASVRQQVVASVLVQP